MWTPNRRARPAWAKIRVIVLHSTGGAFAGAVAWLMNKASQVSAHYVVSRAGQVKKLAPLSDVTWHAGKAEWRGETRVNDISVGIEMEHIDGRQDWPAKQVAAVVALIGALRAVYGPLPVTSHAYVARPRGRKQDPLGFQWAKVPPPTEV